MTEKNKSLSDKALIKKIFGVDPMDWARYPDGKLVFLSPTGQKFSYTKERIEEELKIISEKEQAAKKSASKKPDPKAEEKTKTNNKSVGAAAK